MGAWRIRTAVIVLCLALLVSGCGTVPPTAGEPYPPPENLVPPASPSVLAEVTPYPPPEPTRDWWSETRPPRPTQAPPLTPTATPPPTALAGLPAAFDVLWFESISDQFSADQPRGALWRADPRDIANRQELARFEESNILWAALAPTNDQVAMTVGLLGDNIPNALWAVSADGTNLRQLAPNAGQLLWSQDGRSVFYSTGGDDWVGIEQATVDGGEPRRVLTIEAITGLSLLGWSPDGQWLYHLRSGPEKNDLWRARSDGSTAEFISSFGKSLPSASRLVLSPKGTRFLFCATQGLKWISTDGQRSEDISLPNLNGGYQVFWGDSEQEILVAQHDDIQALYHLYNIDLSTHSVRELATFGIPQGSGWIQLALSPDRQWMMGQLSRSGSQASYWIYLPAGIMVPIPSRDHTIEFVGWVHR